MIVRVPEFLIYLFDISTFDHYHQFLAATIGQGIGKETGTGTVKGMGTYMLESLLDRIPPRPRLHLYRPVDRNDGQSIGVMSSRGEGKGVGNRPIS